tara:strand:- start:740 stop:1198 length:459 start_codon:yes stop_codon:yes gene_type:complete
VSEYTLATLRQAVRDQIVAVDGTPYNQRTGAAAPVFRESDIPLVAEVHSTALGHLSFAVSVSSAQVSSTSPDPLGASFSVHPRIQVEFIYHLRTGRRVADEDLASDAAIAVARSILAMPGLYVEELFSARLVREGEYLGVAQVYSTTTTVYI